MCATLHYFWNPPFLGFFCPAKAHLRLHRCWHWDPGKRSNFVDICLRAVFFRKFKTLGSTPRDEENFLQKDRCQTASPHHCSSDGKLEPPTWHTAFSISQKQFVESAPWQLSAIFRMHLSEQQKGKVLLGPVKRVRHPPGIFPGCGCAGRGMGQDWGGMVPKRVFSALFWGFIWYLLFK